jgi:hypothetical protein
MKEVQEMMRILTPGNNRGFALLDALLCIFITGVILIALRGAGFVHREITRAVITSTTAIIEERNNFTAITEDYHDIP